MYVEFRGAKFKRSLAKQGVPQGGVLSPILFNLYVSKIPQPPDIVKLVTYADDCSPMLITGENIAELEERLNEYLPRLVDFMEDKNLKHSSSTLFTTWGVEMKNQLDINIRRVSIPNGSNPKILGIVLDISLKFAKVSKKYAKAKNHFVKLKILNKSCFQ